jgi:hypothetical protein
MTDDTNTASNSSEDTFKPSELASKGNSGSHLEVDPFAPAIVGDPADAASMAIDQKHLEEFVDAESQSSVVESCKPPRGTFFTVMPEKAGEKWRNRAFFFLLEAPERDPCLVDASIAQAKKDEDTIRPVLLVRYVTMAGQEGLWPLKLNPPDGKSNRWNTSALNVLRIAESGKWVWMISKGEYRYSVSKKTLQETPPKFSDRSYQELVNIAFPEDRRVKTLDHEIWDVLDNGSSK